MRWGGVETQRMRWEPEKVLPSSAMFQEEGTGQGWVLERDRDGWSKGKTRIRGTRGKKREGGFSAVILTYAGEGAEAVGRSGCGSRWQRQSLGIGARTPRGWCYCLEFGFC